MNTFVNFQSIISCVDKKNVTVREIELELLEKNVFAQIADYEDIISSFGDTSTYILHFDLFLLPGFISALQHYKPLSVICCDLNIIACNQNIVDGNYSLIDIGIGKTSILDIIKSEGKVQIRNKRKIPTSPVLSYISNELGSHLNIPIDETELTQTIFNYNNAASLNSYIADAEVELENDIESFKRAANLNFEGSLFGKAINRISIYNFIDSLTRSIVRFIGQDGNCKENVILKSPLTAYNLITAALSSQYAIIAVNELGFLNIPVPAIPVSYDHHLPPVWIYAEIQDLSYEYQITPDDNKQSIKLDLGELNDHLSATSFSIGKMQLTKCLAQIIQDPYDNLHFKIQTMDNKVYYKFIQQ